MKCSRNQPAFQPPAEVLERKDSLDESPSSQRPVVRAVNVALTAAVAFGAFAPHIATLAESTPVGFEDIFEKGSKIRR